jgi:hypothetical protein
MGTVLENVERSLKKRCVNWTQINADRASARMVHGAICWLRLE